MSEPAKTDSVNDLGKFEDFFGEDTVTDNKAIDNDTNSDNRWVTVTEAAQLLGITERTVWRRIKKGKLVSKQVDSRTYVTVDRPGKTKTDPVSTTDESQSAPDSVTVTDSKLVELVSDLTHKLTAAAGRVGYLEAQMQNKEQSIKLLEDKSKEVDETKETLSEVQLQYSKLEVENDALKDELDQYKTLVNRSLWKKFSDWMISK